MRQVLSTAVTAVIVSLLTLSVAGAMARSEPGRAIEPAAGINADRVDGKHAIGFTNKKGLRRGKLVAANAAGELPANIVRPYWGYIKNKPGILADDQIGWNEIQGIPGGFADRVDDGIVKINLTTHTVFEEIAANSGRSVTATCPAGKVTGGGFYDVEMSTHVHASRPTGTNAWYVEVTETIGFADSIAVYAICMTTDPSAVIARLTPAAKRAR